jgi:hypothetical protein
MGVAYDEAANHEAEDYRRPCAEGDRASSLREVSGVASGGCIVDDVGSWDSAIRRVRASGICGRICAGRDSNRSLLSSLGPSSCLEGVFSEVAPSSQSSLQWVKCALAESMGKGAGYGGLAS